MIRMVVSFGFVVVVARWMYAEVQVSAPEVVPFIDRALAVVEIPTHDTWDKEEIDRWIGSFVRSLSGWTNPAHETGDAAKEQ